MSLAIRPFAAQDESRWREMWDGYNTFYKRTVSEEITANTIKRFLDKDVQLFCAVAEATEEDSSKKLIGFVTWFPHFSTSEIEPIVYLNDLFVDPSAEQQDQHDDDQ